MRNEHVHGSVLGSNPTEPPCAVRETRNENFPLSFSSLACENRKAMTHESLSLKVVFWFIFAPFLPAPIPLLLFSVLWVPVPYERTNQVPLLVDCCLSWPVGGTGTSGTGKRGWALVCSLGQGMCLSLNSAPTPSHQRPSGFLWAPGTLPFPGQW